MSARSPSGQRGDLFWLILVAGLFVVASLTLTPIRMPLAWDEITYTAQTSVHVSPITMPPAHSRGAGLLAAPVTLLTDSVLPLRVWMGLLAGAGLLLAMLAWRGLRPSWVIAVAGLLFGSLAVTLINATEVMPDLWEAFGGLALAGLLARAVTRRWPASTVLPLIALTAFFLFVVRYQDALLIVAPLIAGLLLVPTWRDSGVLAAIGLGLALGAAEWTAEAYAFYGGPVARFTDAADQPPRLGFSFSLVDQLRVIDGPGYCPEGSCTGWRYPWLSFWWLAFLALAVLGAIASRRMRPVSSGICLAQAMTVLLGYGLTVPIASPRYLLPVLALLALPAADGMAWLAARSPWRHAAVAGVAGFLAVGALTQSFVRHSELRGAQLSTGLYVAEADQLRGLGVRPPCEIGGEATPLAYYLSCSIGTGPPAAGRGRVTEVLLPPRVPARRLGWQRVRLAGRQGVTAYIRRGSARGNGQAVTG